MKSYPLKTYDQNSFEEHILRNAQDRQHKIETDATPTVADIDEGEFKIFNVSGTRRLYTRDGNSLYYINFTAA